MDRDLVGEVGVDPLLDSDSVTMQGTHKLQTPVTECGVTGQTQRQTNDTFQCTYSSETVLVAQELLKLPPQFFKPVMNHIFVFISNMCILLVRSLKELTSFGRVIFNSFK